MELLYDIMEAKTQHGGTGCSVMSLMVAPAHCNQEMEIISLLYISLFKIVRVGGPFYILVCNTVFQLYIITTTYSEFLVDFRKTTKPT